jgi:hypothetical protein
MIDLAARSRESPHMVHIITPVILRKEVFTNSYSDLFVTSRAFEPVEYVDPRVPVLLEVL